MLPGEPEWLPEDAEAAMEWNDFQASLCSGCAQPRHESFDRRNDQKYETERLVCHGCASRERHAKASQSGPTADTSGSFFVVHKVD